MSLHMKRRCVPTCGDLARRWREQTFIAAALASSLNGWVCRLADERSLLNSMQGYAFVVMQ